MLWCTVDTRLFWYCPCLTQYRDHQNFLEIPDFGRCKCITLQRYLLHILWSLRGPNATHEVPTYVHKWVSSKEPPDINIVDDRSRNVRKTTCQLWTLYWHRVSDRDIKPRNDDDDVICACTNVYNYNKTWHWLTHNVGLVTSGVYWLWILEQDQTSTVVSLQNIWACWVRIFMCTV